MPPSHGYAEGGILLLQAMTYTLNLNSTTLRSRPTYCATCPSAEF